MAARTTERSEKGTALGFRNVGKKDISLKTNLKKSSGGMCLLVSG